MKKKRSWKLLPYFKTVKLPILYCEINKNLQFVITYMKEMGHITPVAPKYLSIILVGFSGLNCLKLIIKTCRFVRTVTHKENTDLTNLQKDFSDVAFILYGNEKKKNTWLSGFCQSALQALKHKL